MNASNLFLPLLYLVLFVVLPVFWMVKVLKLMREMVALLHRISSRLDRDALDRPRS